MLQVKYEKGVHPQTDFDNRIKLIPTNKYRQVNYFHVLVAAQHSPTRFLNLLLPKFITPSLYFHLLFNILLKLFREIYVLHQEI